MTETEFEETVQISRVKKYRGGRHKKSSEDKKDKIIKLYVNEKEGAVIQNVHRLQTGLRKIPLGVFIKNTILNLSSNVGTGDGTSQEWHRISDLLSQLWIDFGDEQSALRGLCKNYNQAAKRINSIENTGLLKGELEIQLSILEQINERGKQSEYIMTNIGTLIEAVLTSRKKSKKKKSTINPFQL